jgi:hypothetical protein
MTNPKMTNIVIVNDGQYRWGADRDLLFAAMERLGWTLDGNRWTEPEPKEDPDANSHYTDLCNTVPHLDGMGPDDARNDMIEAREAGEDPHNLPKWDHPELCARDDLGNGVWSF